MKNFKLYMTMAAGALVLMSCDKEDIKPADESGELATKTTVINTTGDGGSLAQFTMVDEYLYIVDYKSIKVFDVSNPTSPVQVQTLGLGYGIETIHAQNDYIFVGTTTGVKILDATDPDDVNEISEFEHITACDPVVANSQYALSTIRGGTVCGGSINELDIIDINDIMHPTLIRSEQLVNPYGLGLSAKDENMVFVCDGHDGLKAFDISNVEDSKMTMHYPGVIARDVISADNDLLIVLGLNGIYQFDASNLDNLVQKSMIPRQ